MTIAQIKKNMKHGDYNILQKLLKLSTESAARQKFLRGDKDAVEGMIKIQENRSIFCDLHADENCSCHEDLKEAINQKADINHTHDWNEITGKPTEFPPTHHSHNVRDIEGLDDLLHTVDDLRNLSNQKLDRDGSNATGSLASTINNSHTHTNKAVLDTVTSSKVNNWDNAADKAHNAVTLGSNVTGLIITNQVLQFSNGYQLPTTNKISEWDDAYLKRHTHGNKTVLDNLTQSVIDQAHVHSNKSVIDGITAQMVNNWNGSFANNHTHSNKSILDGISSADVANWDMAHASSHTHTNKVILDAISAAYTIAEKSKLATVQPNAQVNVKADWNATSGDAEILNKPTSFTPASHIHAISDVAGLQSELDSKLETPHLNGFVHDVAYNSSLHTLTFYQRNEPNIVIDLPIEHLIKGVQLHGNDLVFMFEDGSNVTIPMNTLLVGVVKSVNGLVANSQGEVVLDISDIAGLLNILNGKANVDASNLTNIANWQSALGINTALNLNLQKITDNGNTTTNPLIVGNTRYSSSAIFKDSDFSFLTNHGEALKILTGGLLTSDNYTDADLIPLNGIHSKGTVQTNTSFIINGNDSNYKALQWNTNGLLRWYLSTDPLQEAGSNSGSDLALYRYSDNGGYLGLMFRANRKTGEFAFNDNLSTFSYGNAQQWYSAYQATQNLSNNYVSKTGDVMSGALLFPDNIYQYFGNYEWAIGTSNAFNGVNFSHLGHQDGVLFLHDNNNVGIGTTSPNYKLDVNGNFRVADYARIGNIGVGDQAGLLRMTRQSADMVGFLSDSNGWADVQGSVIYSYGNGNSIEWNQAYMNSQTALNLTWNDVLNNDSKTTGLPIFNRSLAQKFILKSQSSVGENYFSFQNNAGKETHYIGLGSSGNDNFSFVSPDNTSFNFYSNNNHILQIQDGYIEAYRDLYVSNGGMIYTANHGNSSQWQEAWINGLVNRGDIYTSNIDFNNLPIENRIAGIHTGNGSGNTNLPGYMNGSYGIHTRTVGGAFTTDTVYGNGGEMWYKTWYHPSGANGTDWRKVWDNVNLSDPATETWVNNNFISGSQLNNYLPLSGGTLTGGGVIDSQGNLILQQASTMNATGVFWKNLADTNHISGIGSLTNGDILHEVYMGWGDYPWDRSSNFSVSINHIQYKGQDLWHTGNLADPATETWVTNNFIASSQLNNYLPLAGGDMQGIINLNRSNHTNTGLSWYDNSYTSWTDYMSPVGSGPKNISAPSGQVVTSWARRSFIENAGGYGWTFESGSANDINPKVVAEIRSSDGYARFGAVSIYGGNSSQFLKADGSIDGNAYALVSAIPTNNSQLTNGAGYITVSALNGYASQSWVNSQGFLTSASLPNVSNANITYQGTGAITGGGSHTINQSGNSTYNFDLTNQTKNEISLGVNAYNSLSSKQDALVAGSGISIVGNTISSTNSGGGSGIERIFTDNSQQSGPTASQVPITFTSHEAYGKPETQIDDQEYGNLAMKVETGDVVRFYGSLDNVFTDMQPTGSIYHLDIDGLRKHIYNIIFQSSGGTGGTVRFEKGIYAGDQINITVPKGQQITIQSSAGIVSPYGNGGGFECQTHANLIWDAKLDSWVLVSYD